MTDETYSIRLIVRKRWWFRPAYGLLYFAAWMGLLSNIEAAARWLARNGTVIRVGGRTAPLS